MGRSDQDGIDAGPRGQVIEKAELGIVGLELDILSVIRSQNISGPFYSRAQ